VALDPLEKYLRELRSIRGSGSWVPETSYYPALRDLMNEVGAGLKPKVKCIVHVSHGAGIPDGGLFTPDQFQDGKSRDTGSSTQPGAHPTAPTQPPKPRRYHGTVTLDPARVERDAGKIADEVVTHLVGLLGSSVRVTPEIEAEIPAGVPDNVVRTVTENSRSLKFTTNSGFEKEQRPNQARQSPPR
jgi:hypothetical protein